MAVQQPQFVEVQDLMITGVSTRTKNENEFNPQTAQLPKLWEQFYSKDWSNQKADSLIYGVYSDYESDHTGFYTVTVGIDMSSLSQNHEICQANIEKGHYLVFKNNGPLPQTIIETWQNIWYYFDNKPEYERAYRTDFEVYLGAEASAVYIGVKA